MVLRINPSRMALWRSPNEVQLGNGPGAIRIKGLTSGQERLLNLLYRGVPDELFQEAASLAGADSAADLLDQVRPVLLHRAGERTNLTADYIEKHFAEICRAQANYSTDGEVVVEQRKHSIVFVANCGASTSLIVEALRRSGIGTLIVDGDFDEATACHGTSLENLSSKQIDKIDFAILISHNAVSPAQYRTWLGRSIAHISIVFDSDGVSISPVIETSKTPCLSCFHESETAKDKHWPAIASQLLFSNQRFDDSAAQLFAAGIATQRALQHVDRQRGFEVIDANRTGYRLSMASGAVSDFSWQFDESCKCQL
jgi:hypothetical protein